MQKKHLDRRIYHCQPCRLLVVRLHLKTLCQKGLSAPSRQILKGSGGNCDGMKGEVLVVLSQTSCQIVKIDIAWILHHLTRLIGSLTKTHTFYDDFVRHVETHSALLAPLDRFRAQLMVFTVDKLKMLSCDSVRIKDVHLCWCPGSWGGRLVHLWKEY